MLMDTDLQYGVEWIAYDEGFEQFAYDDETGVKVVAPHGKLTIGYGFNLEASGLSLYESNLILRHRVWQLDKAMKAAWLSCSSLDANRQLACLNIAYNCGREGFLGFHETLAYLTAHDYLSASKDVLESMVAAKERDRYERISETFLTGKLPSIIPQGT